MPVISAILGGSSTSAPAAAARAGARRHAVTVDALKKRRAGVAYGNFITIVINFILLPS